jgi:hypothetical protein
MLLKSLAISAALVIGVSGAAMAQQMHKRHQADTFGGQNIDQSIADGQDHSKDAILPDGTINTDPSVTGPIRAGDTASRLQCAAAPNSVGTRTNTFTAGSASQCP